MLTVKGGVWFSLSDKVYKPSILYAAWTAVKRNGGGAGSDHQGIKGFEKDLVRGIERLSEELRTGSYRPRPIRRAYIDKPGSTEKRPLGIPCVRDRVVQGALRIVIEPIFENVFLKQEILEDLTLVDPRERKPARSRDQSPARQCLPAPCRCGHVKHSHKRTFPVVDKWVRRRLRSILRKRIGLHGISRGHDHFRRPNRFFRDHGLFSLVEVHRTLLQFSSR